MNGHTIPQTECSKSVGLLNGVLPPVFFLQSTSSTSSSLTFKKTNMLWMCALVCVCKCVCVYIRRNEWHVNNMRLVCFSLSLIMICEMKRIKPSNNDDERQRRKKGCIKFKWEWTRSHMNVRFRTSKDHRIKKKTQLLRGFTFWFVSIDVLQAEKNEIDSESWMMIWDGRFQATPHHNRFRLKY